MSILKARSHQKFTTYKSNLSMNYSKIYIDKSLLTVLAILKFVQGENKIEVFNNRYQLDNKIADGGMATVYLGTDLTLQRTIAIKVLYKKFAADPSFVTRFSREAQAAGKLSNPHIVGIHDYGQFEDTYFIVMEYINGETLAETIAKEKSLSSKRTIEISIEIAKALSFAHEQGIVHRDIKPANVMITQTGVAKVSDFGIAQALHSDDMALTQVGTIVGTPRYFSPEQARGLAVDSRSDLYSLGIVMYEMLNGTTPFASESMVDLATKHANEKPSRADANNSEVSADLANVIEKLLAKNPVERYLTADELINDLKTIYPVSPHSQNQSDTSIHTTNQDSQSSADNLTPGNQTVQETTQQIPPPPSGNQNLAATQFASITPPPTNTIQQPGNALNTPTSAMGVTQFSTPQPTNTFTQSGQFQSYQSGQYPNQFTQPENKNNSIYILIGVSVVALLTIVGVTTWLLTRDSGTEVVLDDDDPNNSITTENETEPDLPTQSTPSSQITKTPTGGPTIDALKSDFQQLIGSSSDVSSDVENLIGIDFPDFDTPNVLITGIYSSYSEGYSEGEDNFTSEVTFITDETDIDKVHEAILADIENDSTNWGEPETSDSESTSNGILVKSLRTSYQTTDFTDSLNIEISNRTDEPTIVNVRQRKTILEDSTESNDLRRYFYSGTSEIPLPPNGQIQEVAVDAGQSLFISLDSANAKNVRYTVRSEYEGVLDEDAIKERITASINDSDNFSIDTELTSSELVYFKGQGISRAYMSGFEGSDNYTINSQITYEN